MGSPALHIRACLTLQATSALLRAKRQFHKLQGGDLAECDNELALTNLRISDTVGVVALQGPGGNCASHIGALGDCSSI